MSSAGSIFVDLLLRDAQYTEGMKKASKNAAKFGDAIGAVAKRGAQGVAVAAGAITALTIRQSRAIDETIKFSRSLGVVNENFQALGLLADEAGVSQGKLVNLMTRSQKAIVEAAQGADKYTKAFKGLGLSVDELVGLTPDQQFQKIAESLSKIENPALRNATALQIFGKSGRDVVNMLEDFGGNLEEARAFNDKFAISVNSIDARVVEEANDTFERLGRAIGGIGNQLSIYVSPLVTEFSNLLLASGIDGASSAKAIATAFSAIGEVIDRLREGVIGLNQLFLKTAENYNALGATITRRRIAFAEATNFAGINDREIAEQKSRLEDFQNLAGGAQDLQEKLADQAAAFESTSDKIARIQQEAEARAKEREDRNKGTGNFEGISNQKEAAKQTDELNRLYERHQQLISGVDDSTYKYMETVAELNQLVEAGIISDKERTQAIANMGDQLDTTTEEAQKNFEEMQKFGERAAENIQDAFADFLFDPFQDGLDGMLKGFVDVLRRMIAEQASASLLGGSGGLGGLLGGLFGGQGTIARIGQLGGANVQGPLMPGGAFAGFFAEGGYIPPGSWGVAGEAGAEKIYGGKTGVTVVPQQQGGGNTYIFNAEGADRAAIADLKRQLYTLAGPGVTENRVRNAQRRGSIQS